jgi:RNA polymerase sigma-70 factor (ECF subfamily)
LGITHAQGVSVETDTISNMSAQEILKLVQELAPSYRMVFNLYVVEGYKHKEVAEQLGITEATSRATFATARHKLQKMILDTQKFNQRRANG